MSVVSSRAASKKTNPAGLVPNGALDDSNGGGPAMADGVDSRRLKKRELDRRCQRLARERTKNRIAYLEELVDDFRKQDASGQIANLMRQLADVQKERDELAKTLKTIANSIRTHGILHADGGKSTDEDIKDEVNSDDGPIDRPSRFSAPTHPRRPSFPSSDDRALATTGTCPAGATGASSDETPVVVNGDAIQDPTASSDEGLVHDSNLASPEVLDVDPIFPKPEATCDCCPGDHIPGKQPNLWRYACEALSFRQRLTPDIMNIEDACAEDIPVRAILEGWDAVESFYGGTLPPLWQKLRSIDEVVFQGMAMKERLACLRVMHLLYSYHSEPTAERKKKLPAWYLKRPSQAIVHSYAIDFFAWPGIRERFVFYQHRYCSNTFWRLFNSCLHILWPYEFRDCYFRNATTGQYSISPSFGERLFDLNAWTMSDEMFKKWPEFYSDFPAYNKSTMQIPASKTVAPKSPASLIRSQSAPEAEGRGRSEVLGVSTADGSRAVPDDEDVSATAEHIPDTFARPSHPAVPLSHHFDGSLPVSAPNLMPAPNDFYPVSTFDEWWTSPMQFPQQQVATSAPLHQQHQHQQASMLREMPSFQTLASRSEHMNGIYELSF